MPEISRFFGIVIAMYYTEHGRPHFHAEYGGVRASIEIGTGLIRGDIAARAQRLVLEWAGLHRRELLENWERAREGQPLNPIAPLE
jgi:hypothetical protein